MSDSTNNSNFEEKPSYQPALLLEKGALQITELLP